MGTFHLASPESKLAKKEAGGKVWRRSRKLCTCHVPWFIYRYSTKAFPWPNSCLTVNHSMIQGSRFKLANTIRVQTLDIGNFRPWQLCAGNSSWLIMHLPLKCHPWEQSLCCKVCLLVTPWGHDSHSTPLDFLDQKTFKLLLFICYFHSFPFEQTSDSSRDNGSEG